MNFFRELFYLRKSDRQTILALLCVIVVGLCVVYFAPTDTAGPTPQQAPLSSGMDTDSLKGRNYGGNTGSYNGKTTNTDEGTKERKETQATDLFPFDPNTATAEQLLRLGLRSWQVRNMMRYREAGGVYSRPEDFARLYGLTIGDYERLKPYIRIARRFQPASTLVDARPRYDGQPAGGNSSAEPNRRPTVNDTLRRAVKLKPGQTVNLCTADTTELRLVPGIGVYYASRIYSYGQRLGGYVSVDQLDEIDDLPDGIKHYFIVDGATPRKLNVNRLTLEQLRRHPYINFYQAKAIVDYRRQHGQINSLEQLKLSKDFPPSAIERLKAYVEY